MAFKLGMMVDLSMVYIYTHAHSYDLDLYICKVTVGQERKTFSVE